MSPGDDYQVGSQELSRRESITFAVQRYIGDVTRQKLGAGVPHGSSPKILGAMVLDSRLQSS